MEPQKRARLEITDRQGNRILSENSAGQTAIATLQGTALSANRGTSLNLDWVESVRVNLSAVERRAATIVTRRTVKKDWQIAWLLRAITCMDLTTLQGDDTPGNVRRLCAKARQPVRREVLDLLGVGHLPITVGAVCVYHNLVSTAVEALAGSGIPVAAVSTGFPAGQTPIEGGKARAKVFDQRCGCFFSVQNTAQVFHRCDHIVDRVWIGDENRQANSRHRIYGFAAINGFRGENQIRSKRHDLLDIRIDGATDARLAGGFGWIIAKIGVAGQLIALTNCKNDFSEIGR